MEGLSFAIAFNILQGMNEGEMSRPSWNGTGMGVRIQYPDKHSKMTQPYLYLEKSNGERTPWVPSTGDLFAQDWIVQATENTHKYHMEGDDK